MGDALLEVPQQQQLYCIVNARTYAPARIAWDPESCPGGEPVLVASASGYPNRKEWKVEHAGAAFEKKAFEVLGLAPADGGAKKKAKSAEEQQYKDKFEKKHHGPVVTSEDHYEVLGLAHLRWKATPDQIRLAHRKLVLQYHPDKTKDADDAAFKRITKANDVLSDPAKRRAFDSLDKVDDTIPTETQAMTGDFFELFDPVFERNARWSTVQPVPLLGPPSTPFKEVSQFYEFWWHFQSWREFKLEDEYDPDEAESREEKRWMARQNEKQMQKKKKDEHARIFRLAELAYKCDPRVLKHNEETALQREREKAAKLAATERREQQELASKEAAERSRLAKIAAIKKEKEKEAKKLRDLKSKFRKLAAECPGIKASDSRHIDLLVGTLSPERLREFVDAFHQKKAGEANSPDPLQMFNDEAQRLLQEEQARTVSSELKKQQPVQPTPRKASVQWTEEEYSLLTRAIKRFPVGTQNRWAVVAEFVGTKTEQEVIEKTRGIFKQNQLTEVDAFDKFKKKQLDTIGSPLSQNYERAASPTGTASPTAPASANATFPPSVTDWTVQQQQALEKGLKAFAKEPAATKWTQIAQVVQGKSPNDCFQRFSYLREMLRQKHKQQQPQPTVK
eukprot:TRINITY_DN17503_c0_g1_i1.p1 TRINITY_DN17503_c0_g1~~TRINITY_DN17503_c0_g1_i1.p1  ORF type:complete len:621 (+),score=221.12 TRINITY_DN17503_c0_g1_i1:1426-3288(+)